MPAPRLYLVAPPVLTDAVLRELASVCDGYDIACLRLEPAATSAAEIRRAADAAREVCTPREISLVLTDHFRLAAELALDGVHLASGARHVREARRTLGQDAIVGAYAGASRHDGMTAAEMGADYVSFGPVAASPLGAGATAPVELFEWWSEMIETPVVAEGLTVDAAAAVADHADFLALGGALWSHPGGLRAALSEVEARLPAD
jgi:thiamine-phosphate pyrophosphorylase